MKDKTSTFKVILKKGFGFNLKDVTETIDDIIKIFFGALIGGIVSISIYKNQNPFLSIIIIILIFVIISIIFKIIKSVKR